MHTSDSRTCNGCGKTKPTTEFSKCRRRKSGYQPKCKECNKVDNQEFRNKNKEYWSYETGYFSDKEKYEYIRLYQAADKTIKIYTIKFDDGSMYVGSTKAHLSVRLSNHLTDYKRVKVGKKGRLIPLLHAKLSEFDSMKDVAEHLKNNTYIIDECTGSKTKQYRLEAIWIKRLKNQGYKLLNKQIPTRYQNTKV